MKVKDIVTLLEKIAPPTLQEDYDNSGMQVGDLNQDVSSVLLCLDVTEEVLEEAISKECNLIVSHHPLLFKGIKSLTGKNYIERCIIKACKNDISIYSGHTNYDNILNGVNYKIAEKIGLTNIEILSERKHILQKVVVFVPAKHADNVRDAIFDAGAGHIGKYDACSYNNKGFGTFRAGKNTNPYCGEVGEFHTEEEIRIEVIFPSYLRSSIKDAIISSHPYEEPAFDFYELENTWNQVGAGLIGILPTEMYETELLNLVKKEFNITVIKHSPLLNKKIKRVALCGGSGSFLINDARRKKADVFLTGEIKYHDYFGLDNEILIAEMGHYESEQYTKELFYDIITKNFPNFAVRFSDVITNPIKYF